MLKLLVSSASFGISYTGMSELVDAYPTVAAYQLDPTSTPVTLFFLGSCLCVLAFLGKRAKIEE